MRRAGRLPQRWRSWPRVTIDGVEAVLYSVSSDGKVYEDGANGDLVNTDERATRLRAQLPPLETRHLDYTVSYDDPLVGVEVDQTASGQPGGGGRASTSSTGSASRITSS